MRVVLERSCRLGLLEVKGLVRAMNEEDAMDKEEEKRAADCGSCSEVLYFALNVQL